jgi:hypothetical protein
MEDWRSWLETARDLISIRLMISIRLTISISNTLVFFLCRYLSFAGKCITAANVAYE